MASGGGESSSSIPAGENRPNNKQQQLKSVSSDVSDQPSAVRTVLAQARQDLWRAQPILFSSIFNTLRDFVFDPGLAISCVLIPPLLGPTADNVLAKGFTLMTVPIKTVYCHLPHKEEEADNDTSLRAVSRNVVLCPNSNPRMPKFQPPSDFRSAFQGGISFVLGALGDVVAVMANPKKMKKWVDALGQLNAYLDASGVGDELEEAMMKPMLRGRLLDNIKILNDIQEKNYADRAEKAKCCNVTTIEGGIRDGHRFMRFATAAYGTEMIKSAVDREVNAEELKDQKSAIAVHTGIEPEDVRYIYCKDDSDHHVLHHFAAVDHKSKSVVFALRGTLSLSGAIVDVQGMAYDFCYGMAHQGMAEMADAVWDASGEELKKLFEEDAIKDYGLTITGHSLGAGTACLLNIKCHVEKLVGDRPIFCYGFAPPPTFNPLKDREPNSDLVDKAISTCIAYIHDNDAVPFLSISSVRRLASLLDAVDNETEHMWFWNRWRIFHEWDAIPQNILDSVAEADKSGTGDIDVTKEVDGACEMIIPARVVIWMKANITNTGFTALGCDPTVVARGTVFMNYDMISDHLPEQYEDALDCLLEDLNNTI